jgi:hypothetical protein
MGDKLVVGPFSKGFKNDVTAFNIDNDNFPTLINAYQWRGRVKRKRGTSKLGRLQRYFNSTSTSYNSGSTTITLNGSGEGNILSGFSLQTNGNIVPGSVTITDTISAVVYTDPSMNGTLSPNGTINYATGDITIAAAAGNTVNAVFRYYPDLPVLGLEKFDMISSQFPQTIAFDKTYSYNIQTASPYGIYDVSFYKNPASATYVGYTQKTNVTPTSWNGQDYQQFWTVNYQGAMWTTNGINVPFDTTNIGMQFKPIVTVTGIVAGPPAFANLNIVAHGLVVGDFVFINEVVTTTGINFQTGYVTVVIDPDNVTVEFPNATIATNGTGGIAQYLTNRSDITKDCLRWYDGDPTNGSVTAPILNGNLGWVNFCPPLSKDIFSIADLPPLQYYLVGAKMIVPFKDRLLFIGAVVQASNGSPIYLQDTIVYSQNGTPYYTVSFTGDASLATTVQHPILVPTNQTATASAYWEDQTGFGGSFSAGLDEPINTASTNEDALILGFSTIQTRFIYTGNDLIPFNLFLINSELGSSSTFSAINLDRGVMSRGSRGLIITSQVDCKRFDLDIPDQVFQMQLLFTGTERITAQRDFINEWIYFSYLKNNPSVPQASEYKFPNQTLFYNYRDHSWSIFNESYTHYGQFQRRTGYTWATIGDVYPTWEQWNDPWDSGTSTLLQPEVIAGNQQGFVVFRADGTGETDSLYVRSFSVNTVTSPDHSLDQGDYITFNGCLGTVGSQVNGKIFSVSIVDEDNFILNPPIVAGTYLGAGTIKRMYVPYVQTKQFPTYWNMARKTRIGCQQYLLTRTANSQIQLLIFLSQNSSFAYNEGPIVPSQFPINSSLIYSTVLYTCPESTNLGLTPANVNLQTPTAQVQGQIWHRINTSLIGDSVQIGFTMSDAQMRDEDFTNQFSEIELHGFILDINPSQLLV